MPPGPGIFARELPFLDLAEVPDLLTSICLSGGYDANSSPALRIVDRHKPPIGQSGDIEAILMRVRVALLDEIGIVEDQAGGPEADLVGIEIVPPLLVVPLEALVARSRRSAGRALHPPRRKRLETWDSVSIGRHPDVRLCMKFL
jgi:hypothetical protein